MTDQTANQGDGSAGPSKMQKFLSVFDFVRRAVLPGTLALAGVPADKVEPILGLVDDAEAALGPGTGEQKLQHVTDGLREGMVASGASPETIANVTDMTVKGINSGFAIAHDVQALHQQHIEEIVAGSIAPGATPPAAGAAGEEPLPAETTNGGATIHAGAGASAPPQPPNSGQAGG